MYTTSRVVKIVDERTVVVGCSTEACKGCKAEMFCNTKNDTSFTVRNDSKIEVAVGDMVELYMPPAKTIASTVLVFGLPLALFPLGYFAAKSLFHSTEIINALGGFIAMGVAFLIASLVSIKNKRSLMPVITKKL